MAGKKMFRIDSFKTVTAMRLSYAQNLFTPRAQEEGKKPQCGCTLIGSYNDKELCAQLEKAVLDVVRGEWKEEGVQKFLAGLKNPDLCTIRSPILRGDSKSARNKDTGELLPGMGPDKFFIRVNSGWNENGDPQYPFVVWRNPNVQETLETVYSGCVGKPLINAYAWHNEKGSPKDGVSFGIAGFYKTGEGERIGGSGRPSAAAHFEQVDSEDLPADVKNDGAAGLFG